MWQAQIQLNPQTLLLCCLQDQSDPSMVLAATVGCLLVLSALVMLWHWETTSGTSVTMLAVMTLVFATVFGPWHWWLCTAPPFDGLQHSVSMCEFAYPPDGGEELLAAAATVPYMLMDLHNPACSTLAQFTSLLAKSGALEQDTFSVLQPAVSL